MSHKFVNVETISAEDIDSDIRFYDWDAAHEIGTVRTGELRQISHRGGETTLIFGVGAENEHTFQHGEAVNLNPSPHYDDVPLLIQALAQFHGLDPKDLK